MNKRIPSNMAIDIFVILAISIGCLFLTNKNKEEAGSQTAISLKNGDVNKNQENVAIISGIKKQTRK